MKSLQTFQFLFIYLFICRRAPALVREQERVHTREKCSEVILQMLPRKHWGTPRTFHKIKTIFIIQFCPQSITGTQRSLPQGLNKTVAITKDQMHKQI